MVVCAEGCAILLWVVVVFTGFGNGLSCHWARSGVWAKKNSDHYALCATDIQPLSHQLFHWLEGSLIGYTKSSSSLYLPTNALFYLDGRIFLCWTVLITWFP